MSIILIKCQRVGAHLFPAPSQMTKGAAGYDLYWSGEQEGTLLGQDLVVVPNETVAVNSGWAIEIPKGWVGLIRDRSSMAKLGVVTLGGVIDSDFRGEVKILMRNVNNSWARLRPGERVAQLLVVPCLMGAMDEVDALSETTRGGSGFGSTG
jgi:dUTP pyrophosphatase